MIKNIISFFLRPLFRLRFFENILVNPRSSLYRWRGLLRPSWTAYSKPSYRNTILNELKFTLDISDYMDWKAYFRIGQEESKVIFNKVKDGDVILDVGANLGYYALNFAQRSIGGSVYCFEPDPHNFRKLKKNISQNDFSNIKLFNYGLGKESGSFYLGVIDKHNTGMNSVVSEKNADIVSQSEIHIKALDQVDEILNLKKIDLIKVDIEGYEYHFLLGARQTITKHHPLVFMELCDAHLRRQDSSANAIIELLYDLGYNSIKTTSNQKIEEVALDNCQFDIICQKIN